MDEAGEKMKEKIKSRMDFVQNEVKGLKIKLEGNKAELKAEQGEEDFLSAYLSFRDRH